MLLYVFYGESLQLRTPRKLGRIRELATYSVWCTEWYRIGSSWSRSSRCRLTKFVLKNGDTINTETQFQGDGNLHCHNLRSFDPPDPKNGRNTLTLHVYDKQFQCIPPRAGFESHGATFPCRDLPARCLQTKPRCSQTNIIPQSSARQSLSSYWRCTAVDSGGGLQLTYKNMEEKLFFTLSSKRSDEKQKDTAFYINKISLMYTFTSYSLRCSNFVVS